KKLVDSLPTAAVPAWQPVPRFIFGFDAGWKEPPFDPARARRLLAEAGLEKGFSTTLHVRKLFAAAAPSIRQTLADVGISVEVVVLSDPDFFRALADGKLSFYLSRFGCPTGDASDILDNHVHSRDSARHFGSRNFASYSDPELDRRIEASGQILETPIRREALQEIMKTLRDEVVFVPLFIDQDVFAL